MNNEMPKDKKDVFLEDATSFLIVSSLTSFMLMALSLFQMSQSVILC